MFPLMLDYGISPAHVKNGSAKMPHLILVDKRQLALLQKTFELWPTLLHAHDDFLCDALSLACGLGALDIVQYLAEKGANLTSSYKGGATPLMRAAESGNLAVVDFLFSYGVDLHAEPNPRGCLNYACLGGDIKMINRFRELGADFSVPPSRVKESLDHQFWLQC